MICSSVLSVDGGAIMTAAAPASIAASDKARIAANPGAEMPTTIRMALPARAITWRVMATASAGSSFGA